MNDDPNAQQLNTAIEIKARECFPERYGQPHGGN
jgi:hypothetical protein